ncbi:hypothetical protein Glove_464g3 [Diversispora epigaea]|uniref:C2H2-type domain-containing protein n=1 Tax=Diversispora epigaea TaxID=1348612 RepID=A0A397GR57_9GLOM|nr:hypothetical protein Glove_464g3 [Diversispora epigaea]
MSTNFQCEYCNHYYASRNAYAQHVGRCIKTVICSSTEESGEDVLSMVSSVNEMLLDNEDFSHIDEFQIIQEENLPSDYEGDISFSGRSSNMEECENFDEILPASLRSCENFNEILPTSLRSCENFDEILPTSLRSCENFLSASLRSYDKPEEEPEVERIREFPNEAYADLMTLVIENNLSNKAGNAIIKFFNKYSDLPQSSPLPKNIETGRKFMNKMNISQLSYSKYCILIHNGQKYFIHYRPIKNCIKNLLSNPEILKHFMFKYENSEEEKSYGEQNSGNWWKYAKESIPSSAFILSIILYSDATTTDTLGKNSLHPYIYLLEIFPREEGTRKMQNNYPLFQGDGGVDFKIDGKDVWFFPRISTIICDWPEACTFSLTYKSANSNYPCHFCLVQKEDLINIRKDQLILRDHVNMKEYFNNGTSNSAGLEQVDNYFWNIPNLNIYMATVPDRMHHLDLGLFKYQIEFTTELLKLKPGKLVDDINKKIAKIPRHSGLKVFKKGVQSLSRLTASEYRDMMKIMVFVVDGLYSEDLSNVYKAINDWGNIFIKLFRDISRSNLKFPKLHSWIYHIVDTIQEHRAINGYTTETYESLHKTYVKIPYRLSNKKDVEKQIMKNKTKTPVAFTYTAKLFDFNFSEAIINEHRDNLKLNKNMSKGFAKFIDCLNSYLKLLNTTSEDCRIKIYSSVTLKNSAILRAVNNFHDRSWFSNIAINMNIEELSDYQTDNGICYAQTLLITEIRLPNKSTSLHFTLVQWYDFKSEITPFVYGCSLLELVKLYNFIEIEAIEDTIHVVLRFDKNNEYFDQEGGIKHVKTCLLRSLSLKMAVPFPTSLWSRNKREE